MDNLKHFIKDVHEEINDNPTLLFKSRDEGSLYLTLNLLNYSESECREAVLRYRNSVEKGKISGKPEDQRHRLHLKNAVASLNA